MSKLAPHDDERLVSLLAPMPDDSDIDVRLAAVHALALVAQKGNQEAYAILENFKMDSANRVRSVSERFIAYLELANSGDSSAVRALQHALNKIWRQWSVDFVPEEREH